MLKWIFKRFMEMGKLSLLGESFPRPLQKHACKASFMGLCPKPHKGIIPLTLFACGAEKGEKNGYFEKIGVSSKFGYA